MIKDKHSVGQPHQPAPVQESLPEEVSENPFVNMYQAVKRAIQTIKEDPDDPLSPPFFKTIAIDNGQFARIVRGENTEYETVFPAVFIHFVNVRYLVQQQRIGEGAPPCVYASFLIRSTTGTRIGSASHSSYSRG